MTKAHKNSLVFLMIVAGHLGVARAASGQLSPLPIVPSHLTPCDVRDRQSLIDCMNSIQRGTRDPYIRFVGWVQCTASQPCMISIRDWPTPFYIAGIGPTASGLQRTSGYTGNLIYVQNSDVHMMNFGINEGRNQYTFAPPSAPPPYELNRACGRPEVPSECSGTIFVQGGVSPLPGRVASLYMQNMIITGSKGTTLGAMNTKLHIWNTVFEDSGLFSIWTGSGLLGEIANSMFLSARSAALFFTAHGTYDLPYRIIGNLFDGNHWGMDDCGTRACGGGQVDFAGRTGSGGFTPRLAVFANNIVQNGWSRSPSYPDMPITGVELATIVDSVAIVNNLIVRNIGTGISRNPTTSLSNMVISGNVLNNTPGNLYNLTEFAPYNCEGSNCRWSLPVGSIVGARENCGGSSCPWRIDAKALGSAVPLSPLLVCGSYSVIGSFDSAHLLLPGNIPSGTECSLYESPNKLLLLARAWIP